MYTTESQKEEFLKEYFRSRVVSTTMCNAIMNRALQNEQVFKKAFYAFTKEEIMQMYTNAKVKSNRTLQNWNLTLKHASRWFLHTQNKSLDNAYDTITREDLDVCIDVNMAKQMLISEEQLRTMQDDILNYTDKAILSLLFLGVGGDMLKEITFLTEDQLSASDKRIYFRNGKMIILSDRDFDIVQKACREDALVSYSVEGTVIGVSTGGIYKVRGNTVNNNDDIKNEDDRRRRMRWLHRRINIVSDYLGVPMTPKSINASGLWHALQMKMKEKGIDDLKEYLSTDSGRRVCWRYGFMGEHYAATVLDKFRKQL